MLEYSSPRRYDAIVNMGVTEHLPDYRATLRKYAELVKPGGRVYLDALAMRTKHNVSTFAGRYIYPGKSSPCCTLPAPGRPVAVRARRHRRRPAQLLPDLPRVGRRSARRATRSCAAGRSALPPVPHLPVGARPPVSTPAWCRPTAGCSGCRRPRHPEPRPTCGSALPEGLPLRLRTLPAGQVVEYGQRALLAPRTAPPTSPSGGRRPGARAVPVRPGRGPPPVPPSIAASRCPRSASSSRRSYSTAPRPPPPAPRASSAACRGRSLASAGAARPPRPAHRER